MERAVLLSVAILVLCIGITACDDDGGASTISCDIPEANVCFSGEGTASECTDAGGDVVNSCPDNAGRTCEVDNNGSDVTMYAYGTTAEYLTCEQLADTFDLELADDDDNKKSNNDSIDNNNSSSGRMVSCDNSDVGICMDIPDGSDGGGSCEDGGAVTVDACPGNAVKVCDINVVGVPTTIHIYDGSDISYLTCADLQNMM